MPHVYLALPSICLALPPCLDIRCLQFVGWMIGCNTFLEYLLAGATVAKGFSSYFTVLIGGREGVGGVGAGRRGCVHAVDA